ncbi:hypothetical protein GBAR_LOCUS14730 [Geodia barretti]|uniref:Death domain-containing protein n=1 Tax=Geodia barretti TaxID=519541 RepID=A0AA35S8N5_GEOBA|nr:hypothetical protein GBAR_LOCUS14730 [Geodia barretti]
MVKSKIVPACLFRNAVRLQHPIKAVEITLLHALKHFEVHLDASQADLPSICPEIRDMLMDAVDSAASAFRFKNSRASVAFQCPCSPDDVHTATPNEAHSNLICTLTGKNIRGGLTPAQRVWLGPQTAPVAESATTSLSTSEPVSSITDPPSPSTRMGRPTLPQLLRLKIPQRVGSNYSTFGILLLNDTVGSRVDSLEELSKKPEKIVLRILQEWVEGRGVEPVTWETLIKTLRDCDLSDLADEVHQKLPSSHS